MYVGDKQRRILTNVQHRRNSAKWTGSFHVRVPIEALFTYRILHASMTWLDLSHWTSGAGEVDFQHFVQHVFTRDNKRDYEQN